MCSKFAKYYGVLRKIPEVARSAVSPLVTQGLNHTQTFFPHEIGKKITADLPGKNICVDQLGIYSLNGSKIFLSFKGKSFNNFSLLNFFSSIGKFKIFFLAIFVYKISKKPSNDLRNYSGDGELVNLL